MNNSLCVTYRPVLRSYLLYWLFCWLIFPIFIMVWQVYSTSLVVTNDSVMLRLGLLSRREIGMRLDRVQAVEVRQNLFERILGYGTIMIGSSATSSYEIAFSRAGHPESIAAQIRSAQSAK